ncbi:MAG: SsrA-binding protein SmpB [Paludibacteraceae bacterium]|nr:SsrA-binding protein SmpB [Paludibacteraceae bacterium]
MEINNKRAAFDYFLSVRLTAGIVLVGTEIKSIREGKASLADSYCMFIGEELWVKNMQISAYRLGTFYNHEVKRDRKLLLTKRELHKFHRAVKETGYTIVPIRIFIDESGLAKMEIALARGKKSYDKRQTMKENDAKREMREEKYR